MRIGFDEIAAVGKVGAVAAGRKVAAGYGWCCLFVVVGLSRRIRGVVFWGGIACAVGRGL